ncbi:hypothetical protein [Aureimonas leprariae]|uniref:Uncharacterized protein n=1 Tax=Plantimonas leprariae TaxID=2615207 RepID=A0A7V7PSF2_9HYPH|nr:hypothetical protein [Aureimonas leprariae]KAB0682017.1 hypothetical protein F6X38_04210 [Aureimonas leprariae]
MVATPRSLPAVAWASIPVPELQRFVSASRSGERLANVVEYADPAWTASLTTKAIHQLRMRPVSAWWKSLREGLRPVLYRHPAYVCPAAHVCARGPEADAGYVTSIASGNILGLGGLAAGLVLAPGDFLSFKQGALTALGQIVETSGNGSTRTVEIEPPLPRAFVAGAQVLFDRIELLMRPVPGSWSEDPATVRSATFQLIESRL